MPKRLLAVAWYGEPPYSYRTVTLFGARAVCTSVSRAVTATPLATRSSARSVNVRYAAAPSAMRRSPNTALTRTGSHSRRVMASTNPTVPLPRIHIDRPSGRGHCRIRGWTPRHYAPCYRTIYIVIDLRRSYLSLQSRPVLTATLTTTQANKHDHQRTMEW